MQEEIKEYEITKFKRNSIIEKKLAEINIEMNEKLENIEVVKMRELQKTFKIYQKIIKELIAENKRTEKKIESLINENAALKGERNRENIEKFKNSSFFLEENDSSRKILMQNDSFGLARKNLNHDFFSKPVMKITHEEVDQEKILPNKLFQLERNNSNDTQKTTKYEMNLRKILRKSIFLDNQMEFNFKSDSLDVYNINLTLKENIATLSLDDIEIMKDKGNNNIFSNFFFLTNRFIFILRSRKFSI